MYCFADVVSSKFQDSFGAGYTFQETLPCTNKKNFVELKRFALCVSIRLNKPLTTYILSLTLNPNQAFQRHLRSDDQLLSMFQWSHLNSGSYILSMAC